MQSRVPQGHDTLRPLRRAQILPETKFLYSPYLIYLI